MMQKPALTMFHAAAIQLRSSPSVADNLSQLAALFETLDASVDLVVLPENFAYMGRQREIKHIAESYGDGMIQSAVAALAKDNGVWLVAGTIPIIVEGVDQVSASCLVFDPQGEIVHHYQKKHLFDADLTNGESYRESDSYTHGDVSQPCYFESPWGKVGLSVCYDLRFPEHFRQMPDDLILHCIPAAFTYQTGQAHWEVLLRARAIENQSFVIGAAQTGVHANNRQTWGHSCVINPWGTVINCLPETVGTCVAEIDLKMLQEVRQNLPCLQHKRV